MTQFQSRLRGLAACAKEPLASVEEDTGEDGVGAGVVVADDGYGAAGGHVDWCDDPGALAEVLREARDLGAVDGDRSRHAFRFSTTTR